MRIPPEIQSMGVLQAACLSHSCASCLVLKCALAAAAGQLGMLLPCFLHEFQIFPGGCSRTDSQADARVTRLRVARVCMADLWAMTRTER